MTRWRGVTVVGLAALAASVPVLAVASPITPALANPPGAAEARAQVPPPGDPPGTWWYTALGLDEVHAQGATGEGVTVGLIDSIVDPTVPELTGVDVVPALNACRMLDPVSRPEQAFGSGPGADHGTVMASLIAGTGVGNSPGGQGTRGVAPDATVRVYAVTEIDGGAFGESCDGVDAPPPGDVDRAAFEQAVADGVDIINFSSGVAAGSRLDEVLERAADEGVVVVAGAGNEGEILYPARASAEQGVVAVNPVASTAELPGWAPRDPAIVVAAPGVGILAGGTTAEGWQSDGWGEGSSYATAVVSGALAIVKSRYPEATAGELVQHLIRHTTDEGLQHDPGYGFGIIALEEMVANDPTRWEDVNPLTRASDLPALPQEYPDAAATDEAAAERETPDEGGAATAEAGSGPTVAAPGDGAALTTAVVVGVTVALLLLAAIGGVLALVLLGVRGRRPRRVGPITATHAGADEWAGQGRS